MLLNIISKYSLIRNPPSVSLFKAVVRNSWSPIDGPTQRSKSWQTLKSNAGNMTDAQKATLDQMLKTLNRNFAGQGKDQYISCDGVINPDFLPDMLLPRCHWEHLNRYVTADRTFAIIVHTRE
jgi:hypothetical protein